MSAMLISGIASRRLQSTRRKATVGLAVIVVGLASASCSSSNSPGTSGDDTPTRGGTLVQLEKDIAPTIDPALNQFMDTTLAELEAIYGPGLVYTDSKTGEVKMGFAESLTTGDNGHVWTLKLRTGLKFSDDTAFDAAAVAFNLARAADPATGSPMQAAAKQLSTKVIDATTLEITSNPSNAQFPTIMAQNFAFVASPTAIRAAGKDFGAKPVGPGPFKVKSYDYGVSWTFERNPNYELFAPGQPYLDGVKIVRSESNESSLAAIQAGQGDTWRAVNGQSIDQSRKIGLTVGDYPQPAMGYLTFNTTRPPFDDVRARKAVYLALDREAVTNVWLAGNSTAMNLFSPGGPFYSQQYDFPKANAAEAQRLFDELAAEGKRVEFAVTWPEVGAAGNVAAYVPGVLSKFKNVTATEKSLPRTQYKQDQATGNFQMTSGSINSLIPGAFDNFKTGGGVNWGMWSDPKVDDALATIQSSTDQGTLKKAWNTIQQEIIDQVPFVPAWRGNYGFAYDAKKFGGLELTYYGQAPLFGGIYIKST